MKRKYKKTKVNSNNIKKAIDDIWVVLTYYQSTLTDLTIKLDSLLKKQKRNEKKKH